MASLSKEAKREYDRARYQQIKEERKAQVTARNTEQQNKIRAIKMDSGCSHCGTKEDVSLLQFHHVDSSTKKFHIADSRSHSWESLKEEMAKCIILCQTCHTNEHLQSA